MSIIHIEGLTKSFGSNLVFQDVNVDIEKGDCICVIGPSGCGKSTFLRCINLLERPSGGKVYIDGQEITAKGAPLDQIRRKMGMVYQTFNLFSHKTVLENVMMAPMHLQTGDHEPGDGLSGPGGHGGAGRLYALPALRRAEAARRHSPLHCHEARDHSL